MKKKENNYAILVVFVVIAIGFAMFSGRFQGAFIRVADSYQQGFAQYPVDISFPGLQIADTAALAIHDVPTGVRIASANADVSCSDGSRFTCQPVIASVSDWSDVYGNEQSHSGCTGTLNGNIFSYPMPCSPPPLLVFRLTQNYPTNMTCGVNYNIDLEPSGSSGTGVSCTPASSGTPTGPPVLPPSTPPGGSTTYPGGTSPPQSPPGTPVAPAPGQATQIDVNYIYALIAIVILGGAYVFKKIR